MRPGSVGLCGEIRACNVLKIYRSVMQQIAEDLTWQHERHNNYSNTQYVKQKNLFAWHERRRESLCIIAVEWDWISEFHLMNCSRIQKVICDPFERPLERVLWLLVPAYTNLKGSYDEEFAVIYCSIQNSKSPVKNKHLLKVGSRNSLFCTSATFWCQKC